MMEPHCLCVTTERVTGHELAHNLVELGLALFLQVVDGLGSTNEDLGLSVLDQGVEVEELDQLPRGLLVRPLVVWPCLSPDHLVPGEIEGQRSCA